MVTNHLEQHSVQHAIPYKHVSLLIGMQKELNTLAMFFCIKTHNSFQENMMIHL